MGTPSQLHPEAPAWREARSPSLGRLPRLTALRVTGSRAPVTQWLLRLPACTRLRGLLLDSRLLNGTAELPCLTRLTVPDQKWCQPGALPRSLSRLAALERLDVSVQRAGQLSRTPSDVDAVRSLPRLAAVDATVRGPKGATFGKK